MQLICNLWFAQNNRPPAKFQPVGLHAKSLGEVPFKLGFPIHLLWFVDPGIYQCSRNRTHLPLLSSIDQTKNSNRNNLVFQSH